jgi:hypothetical protein
MINLDFKQFVPAALIALLSFLGLDLFAQDSKKSLDVYNATEEIILDGELKESSWSNAQKLGDFYQQYPYDTAYAKTKTEVFVTYDETALYVAAICYDNNPEKAYVIQSLKRDFSYPISDAFAIYLDPFEDETNGFSFAVNPMGAQREGSLANGGTRGVGTAWDTKWFSKVKREKDKWVVEMKIPFKSIRFRKNEDTWNINFSRNNLKIYENSTWVPVPRNFNVATLTYTGKLNFETAPIKPKLNMAIIPFVSGTNFTDKEVSPTANKFNTNIGLDAKIAITSSLNLDLTYRPDFSQVEVDAQQINLTRFNLFFPEKRLFFIENSDLFSNFGFRQIRPFFSRRIGLQTDIIGGARLSGKVGTNWRVGVMTIQTEGKDSFANAQNYTVAAVQRQIFKTNNIAAIAINRQRTDNGEIGESYNRVLGLDYNMYEWDNKLRGKFFYHQAFTPEKKKEQFTHASWVMYNDKKWFGMWNHEYVGKNYNAEVGFVPRNKLSDKLNNKTYNLSYWRLEPEITRRFFPKKGKIVTISPGIYHSSYYDSTFTMTESLIRPYVNFEMNNSSKFGLRFENRFSDIYFPADILSSDTADLLQGEYRYNFTSAFYTSNSYKKLYYDLDFGYGQFYSAKRTNLEAEINYRYQPYGTFSIGSSADFLETENGKNTRFILVGAKAELAFTKAIFFSTFVQYNTQLENTNIYSRLQWRFRPMSDFFLVYSDNYNNLLKNKNKTLSFKLIYWFNT